MKVDKIRARASLVLYLFILFLIVLTPVSNENEALLGMFRFEGLVERILNLFLLFPLPYLIMRSFEREPLIFLVSFGPTLSIFIEYAQKCIPGRVSDPLDFALNSLGYLACLVFLRRGSQFTAP